MPRVDLPPTHAPVRRPTHPAAASTPPGQAPAPRRLTFVTGNPGKLSEMSAMLSPLGIEVVGDARGYQEPQAATLRDVTEAGARQLLAQGLQAPFMLEDSGLFVAALRGFPGVYSRHALETVGVAGLLRLLRDVELEMRSAAFQADLCYVDAAGALHHFEGTCRGRIAERPAGTSGFGFDPVFVPEGHAATFAEMDEAAKGRLSHRGKAAVALFRHLSEAAKP
ncbi:MAG TPA: RdgB/HAM1 family non-canonical purine NTP pyrophosphatase [Candidatus Thermoplasmatota archaeon]|nr:RdgB/HAM1 family non-canonical purine NTP pyrophosphatase [Candidatus Thermoplasmatota archaeon]